MSDTVCKGADDYTVEDAYLYEIDLPDTSLNRYTLVAAKTSFVNVFVKHFAVPLR